MPGGKMTIATETERLARQSGRGRDASDPTAIPAEGWKDVLWRVYRSIVRDRVMLTAAGVTYYLLLSLVPTLSAFVSIYGLFANRTTVLVHVNMLAGIVPSDGLDIIRQQLTRLVAEGDGTLGATLLVSLGIALWSASAGVRAMFEAMNVAYGEQEKRNFFQQVLVSIVFTVGGAVSAVLLISIVVVLPGILALLQFGTGLEWLLRLVSYGLMLMVLLVGLAALYRWGPSREQPKWRWITPGAALALILTVVVSLLFSWYVTNFGHYNATYGSLGALIGLLTWVWLSVIIVIIGGELNSEVEHQTARDSTTGPELPMGERGAYMADTVGYPWPPRAQRPGDGQAAGRLRKPDAPPLFTWCAGSCRARRPGAETGQAARAGKLTPSAASLWSTAEARPAP